MVVSSYLNFYCKKEKKFLPGEVKVKVLAPFQTRGMDEDSVGQLTKHMQDTMQKEFELINKEINLDEKYYTIIENRSLDTSTAANVGISNSNTSSPNLINFSQSSSMPNDESLNDTNRSLLNDDNNNSINEEDIGKKKT